jgi:hypothetical protein
MTVIVTKMMKEITIEKIPVIEGIAIGTIINRAPVHDNMMIVITMKETGMREDIQMIGTEREMTTTAMIGLTDAGPDTTMIMTMTGTINAERSPMIETDLNTLMIGIRRRSLRTENLTHPQGT